MARYVGKRIVPKHCGYWDNTKEYEMESVVYDRTSGNSYISRKAVPAGTDISQEEYWALCSDFNMQMDLLEKHFTATEQRIVADNDATEQAIRQDNQTTREHVDSSLQHTTEELTETVNQAKNSMTEQKGAFDQTAAALNARMDAVLAAGTGTGETEILDARVDAEGNEHATLGEAIRASETRTADRLSAVGTAIGDRTDVDLTSAPTITGLIAVTSGRWATGGARHTFMIPVPKLTAQITVKSNDEAVSVVALLKSNNYASGTIPDYATGGSRVTIPIGATKVFYVPEDCAYIAILKDFEETIHTPDLVEFLTYRRTLLLDDTLTEEGSAADAKKVGDKIDRINALFHKEVPYDLAEASVVKGFIVISTKWTIGNDRRSFIFARPEKTERMTVSAGECGVAVGLWKSKDFISESQVPCDWAEGETRRYVNAGETNTFDLPDDCAFICLSKEFQEVDHTPSAVSFYTLSLWDDSPKYEPIPLGLHEMPENEGVLNVIKRCRQLTDIRWTPAVDLPRLMLVQRSFPVPDGVSDQNYEGVFKAGVEYKGVPYGRCNRVMDEYGYSYAFVGSHVGFDTFISSIMNPKSKLSLESRYALSNHETTIYAAVCSALTSYALGVSYHATANIPSIPGLELVGKINDDGVLLDQANIKLGDCLDAPGVHTAMITDIIRDADGNIQVIEICDASTAGLADRNYADGQVGGLCRRKGWTIDQFYSSWGVYSIYRYKYIADVPYTPSPYVNVGDEADMFRIEHYPVMPYEGENFTYKTGHIPGDAVRLVINLAGYSNLRVFKDGEEINGSPFAVTADLDTVNVETIDAGEYSAYLCNMNGDSVKNLSATCHWKIV